MRVVLSVWILGIVFISGCASSGASPVADGKTHGECLVCKHNSDLACVDIVVDDSTPRRVRDGQTYYFCSEDCAKAFDKDPATYCVKK
jgi:YHS domain-containing protein